jgi:hypothetical protein
MGSASDRDTSATPTVRVALAIGLALLGLAIVVTLLRAPVAVIATNGIPDAGEVARTRKSTSACQAGEVLPAGTSAIRLTLAAEIGPAVTVAVRSAGRTVTRGSRGDGWTGASVTVPVRRVSRTTPAAKLCFTLGRPLASVEIFGEHASRAGTLVGPRGEPLPGRLGVEYLGAGRSSWLSLLPSVARRMGFGHAWGGAWIALALLAAMASAAGLLAWLAGRELRPEEPR